MTLPRVQPIAPTWRKEPFDPDWLFDLKYDGFRALYYIEPGHHSCGEDTMSSANEPPIETPKPDGLPPGVQSNWAMMDSGAFVARMHAERQRQFNIIAALTLAPGPLPENHPFYALVGRVASVTRATRSARCVGDTPQ